VKQRMTRSYSLEGAFRGASTGLRDPLEKAQSRLDVTLLGDPWLSMDAVDRRSAAEATRAAGWPDDTLGDLALRKPRTEEPIGHGR
jgi:hypothetical protein